MKKIYKKYFILFIILTLICFNLSGCYNINNIDKLAYVIAIGLDVGESNILKLSFQISALGNSSGGDGPQSDNPIVNTVECSSIDSGISIINSYLSAEINLSHCKAIVISEEFASKPISKYIYTLLNNIQVRPDTNIIITKCDVATFFEHSKPELESMAAKYYETVPTSSDYTAYTQDIKLNDFFSALNSTYENPIAILGGVNNNASNSTNNSSDTPNFEKDNSSTSGNSNIDSSGHIETIGLAVFKEDVLVGELTALETLCHLITIGKIDRCNINIPSPFIEGETVTLSLKQKHSPKITAEFINDSPYIRVEPSFEARLLTVNENETELDAESLKQLEDYATSYLNSQISNYLYKTSRTFKSDIDGFGKYFLKNFVFWNDWISFDWNSNFENTFFKVDTNVNVISSLLLMQS